MVDFTRIFFSFIYYMQPASIYLFKFINWNTRTMCKKIYSKLTIKTPERHQWFWTSKCLLGQEGSPQLQQAKLRVFMWMIMIEVELRSALQILKLVNAILDYSSTNETELYSMSLGGRIISLSVNITQRSNTFKQFVGCYRWTVWVCLTIFGAWRVRGYYS